jgi:hypothetical protein
MYYYDTLSEATDDLRKRGYTYDFAIFAEKECLICHEYSLNLSPDDFYIDEVYRFEGDSDPGDEMIVHAISSDKYKLKGIVVNAFGTYADSEVFKIVKHLQRHLIK